MQISPPNRICTISFKTNPPRHSLPGVNAKQNRSRNWHFPFKTLVNICTFLEAQRGGTTTLYWGVVPDPPLIGEWHRKLIKIRIWGWPELENFNFKTNPYRKMYFCSTNESNLITKRYNKRNILMPNPPPNRIDTI